jgi:ribose transport system substrate-binding protein
LNIVTDLITANPDLRGVFASNLTMAQGAGQAIAENKVSDKVMLIGFDLDDTTVKFLADGNIKALVVQDPFRMGYEGVKIALAASKGESVSATIDTGVNLITKENMNTPRSQEFLNPRSIDLALWARVSGSPSGTSVCGSKSSLRSHRGRQRDHPACKTNGSGI